MFREIDAECYLMIDGDDTYPLDCAQEMVDRVLQHQADMVVGDRLSSTYFTENKRPFHNFGNSLMRAGINSLFHANIKDIMTGYRAFSYEFVKTFPVFSKGFEIETEMTIHAVNYNMQVENVVVEYRDRPQGSESKLNTYSDGFRVIRKMMQLYKNYKPLHFFGMLALLLIAVSAILFVPVFLEYLVSPEADKLWCTEAQQIPVLNSTLESCAEFIDTPDNEFMITTSDIYANSALVFSGSYPITGFALDLQNAMIYAYSDGYTVPEALEQAAKDFTDRNVSR